MLGLYWGNIGIMEKKMKITTSGIIAVGIHRDSMGYLRFAGTSKGLYRVCRGIYRV